MKKIALVLGVLALGFSIYNFLLISNQEKQAYVDINRLIEGYNRTPILKKAFDKKAETAKANIDSLISGWQNDLKNYESSRSSMTNKELDLQKQILNSKQQQIESYRQVIQNQLKEEDQKNTSTIINDINDFVKNYGTKNNYQIIFGASGQGNIMYAKDAIDITEDVLIALNNDFTGN